MKIAQHVKDVVRKAFDERVPRQKISRAKKQQSIERAQIKKDQEFQEWLRSVRKRGMYPLDAPGMPPPGPNFLRHANDLFVGETEDAKDSEEYKVKVPDPTKKSGFRQETRFRVGDQLRKLYLAAIRKAGFKMPIEMKGGKTKEVVFVPGHIWGQYYDESADAFNENARSVDGPHPAKVLLLGKMPWEAEVKEQRNLMGASGEILRDIIQQFKVLGTPNWYVTNLLKFMPPDGTTTIKAAWLKDCLPILHQELRIVKPQYIICLGADSSKALLGPKFGVGYMEGRVIEYTYPTGVSPDDPRPHTALVMTVVHPAQVAREESARRQLERGVARFNLLQQGNRFDLEEKDIDHRTISTLPELQEILYEIEHDPKKKDSILACDAEWHGEHPVNKGSYIRTIQFAWRPKCGFAVRLYGPGGVPVFKDADGKPAVKKALKLLQTFVSGGRYNGHNYRKKRIVGHFFVADLEWLVDAGLDIRREYAVPLYDLDLEDPRVSAKLKNLYRKKGFKGVVPAWARTRYEGGADTGMMAHAIEESANYKLEMLALRYTTVPRYDVPLHDWRESYCKQEGLKAKDLEGYGMCPDSILIPYGIYDADATLRLYYEFHKLLDHDYEGNCCREAFWESMIATPAILEIHRNGILVDKQRIDFLTEKFMAARARQEKKIKSWTKWPDFNIRSVQHVKEFLFGEDLNGKITKDGKTIRIRPAGAQTLNLVPLIDTGKPPKQWADLMSQGREKDHSPSTNKQVLAILAQENDALSTQINWIRDYRFLDQVLKTTLRPPVTDEATGEYVYEVGDNAVEGTLGELTYDAGLASVICSDKRVRTHLYPTAETGRWKSARPNLQNISNQRDDDYRRLLGAVKNENGKWIGGDYKYPLRSIFVASPGTLLVECDYTGAELYGMAIMSGDPTMIDHATRNQLPEDDPRYYDIHSNVACLAFGFRCAPTKDGLDSIGKKYMRIIAKNVIFGIAYGRGAKAIAFAAKEQGINISVDEAQKVIDTIFGMYPGLVPFFEECKQRAVNERWLCHCFGRFRRFPRAQDSGVEGEFQRQAMNFPIQGMIASAVDRAIAYLYDYKRTCGTLGMFNILLQIHDALLLEVPYQHVEFVTQEVLPWAMRKMVPIYPTRLNGRPTGKGPFYLGAEAKVFKHWGEMLPYEKVQALGITRKKWTGDGMVVKYAV